MISIAERKIGKKKKKKKLFMKAALAFFIGKIVFVIIAIKAIALLNLKVTLSLVFLGFAALVAKLVKVVKVMYLKKLFAFKKVGLMKGGGDLFSSGLLGDGDAGRSLAESVYDYYNSAS